MSNSTDPFQPLEELAGHTRIALEQILKHRERFTTVTVLTKNPLRPVQLGYVGLFEALGRLPRNHPSHDEFTRKGQPGFVIEVSLAFWRELPRQHYDPCAPSVDERKQGLRALREAGVPLVLRVDPLFPQVSSTNGSAPCFEEFGLVEPQTLDDLEHLVTLAKELNVRHVVYSAAKITQPRGRKLSETMRAVREFYRACSAPEKLDFHGGSWRLPHDVAARRIVRPFLEICNRRQVTAKYCKQNLTETP